MKSLTVGLMALLAMICFTSSSFAASKPSHDPIVCAIESSNSILGKLVSVDSAKDEIVVKDQETGSDMTILVDAKDSQGLQRDNLVKIVLAPGSTDRAGFIEVVKPDAGKRGPK
jgi:hypothetical protein